MALKILHCANARLGATFTSLGYHGREQRAHMLETFSDLATLARMEQAHLVLVSGDLFDCAVPGARTLNAVRAFFERLHDAGICAVVLPGARDPEDLFDPAADTEGRNLCPHAIVLGPESPVVRLETLNLQVQAIALRTMADDETRAPRLLVDPNGPAIGIGLGYLGTPGERDLARVARSLADSGLRYVGVGGDSGFAVHVEGGTTLCSPGVPEPLDWDQDGGSVAMVEIDDDGAVTVVRRRCGTRRFQRRQLEITPANAPQIVGIIQSMADQGLALEIVLTGDCPVDVLISPAAIEEHLAPAFYHLRVVDRTAVLLAQDELPQGTIVANFARIMDGRIRDAVDAHHAQLEREATQLGLSLLQGASIPR